jgi:two-component system nitrate/nitrite response regulator NarL
LLSLVFLDAEAKMAASSASSVRVAIVTNQRLFRDAMGQLLRHRGGFDVMPDSNARSLDGDIAIVDSMAIQADAGLLTKIRARFEDRPILVIVSPTDATPITSFIDAGVAGVLDWSCSGEYLRETLSRIHVGETVVAVSLARQPANGVQGHMPLDLTLRERQVIRELATGKSNVGIARALGVTENTVKGHLVNIFEKLGVDNRVQVTTFAIQNGLLGGESDGLTSPGSQVA